MEPPTAPETVPAPGDPSGGAPDTVQADIDDLDARLDEVEASLARIDAGTYGRCEGCGTLLDDKLLAERPTARRCTTCPSPTADGGPAAATGTPVRS
jgi:hypothetical protein